MTISPTDPTWLAVAEEIKSRIEEARDEIERMQPDADTAFIRGRIAELRDLLKLAGAVKMHAIPQPPTY